MELSVSRMIISNLLLILFLHIYHGGGTYDLRRHCINIVAASILKLVSTSMSTTSNLDVNDI